VPAPVKVNWQPVVPVVIAPAIATVPVEIEIISLRVVVVALMVSVPQESVPAPTAIVQVRPNAGLGMLTRPVTVREFDPLIVIRLVAFTAANVREAQLAATSTVQFAPLAIVTSVALVGIPALQRAELLQLPVPLNVDCPSAVMLMKIENTSKHPACFNIFLIDIERISSIFVVENY